MSGNILDVANLDKLIGITSELSGNTGEPKTPSISLKKLADSLAEDSKKAGELLQSLQVNESSTTVITDDFKPINEQLARLLTKSNQLVESCVTIIDGEVVLDAELVSSIASLIESTRAIISDYISMYRDKLAYIQKVELTKLNYKLKRDNDEYKLKLQAELAEKAEKSKAIPVDGNESSRDPNKAAWNTDDILKRIVKTSKSEPQLIESPDITKTSDE